MRKLMPDVENCNIPYLHYDDFYIFSLLKKGEIRINVDFVERAVKEHSIACMLPGQVHKMLDKKEVEGYLLFIDGALLGDEDRWTMRRYAFSMQPLFIDSRREAELDALFPMLQERVQTERANDFARAIVSVFTEIIGEKDNINKLNPRH